MIFLMAGILADTPSVNIGVVEVKPPRIYFDPIDNSIILDRSDNTAESIINAGAIVRNYGNLETVKLRSVNSEGVKVKMFGVNLNPVQGGGTDLLMLPEVPTRLKVKRSSFPEVSAVPLIETNTTFIEMASPTKFKILSTLKMKNLSISAGVSYRKDFLLWKQSQSFARNDEFFKKWFVSSLNIRQISVNAVASEVKTGAPGMENSPTPSAESRKALLLTTIKARIKSTEFHLPAVYSFISYTNPDAFYGPVNDHHKSLRLSPELTFNVSDKLAVSPSFQYERADSTKIGIKSRETFSFKVKIKPDDLLTISGKLNICGGLYGDASTYLVMPVSESVAVHSSAFFYNRLPSFNDLYWPPDPFAEGNPQLKPETSFGGEVGVIADTGWFTADASVFLKFFKDLIEWNPSGTDGKWTPENASKTRFFGADILASVNLWKVSADAGLNFVNAVYTSEDEFYGNFLPFTPFLKGFWEVSLNLPVKLTFSGKWSSYFYANKSNTKTENGFATFNIKMTLEKSGSSFTIYIENLTDEKVSISRNSPAEGRTFGFTLHYTL